jgi:isopentenyl diphosphate isomerase/L-lactate dehydrogenase-like FMN-dependent dehydrogenase
MLTRYLPPSRRAAPSRAFQATLTWDTMERIRDMAGLPFMVKGIQTGEDAEIAVKRGVDVLWVSNHGGRQIDHGQGSLDVLPEVVQAAQGKAQIIVDGGVQRGSDILKAVALGADAVALGRLQGWALAAGGYAGVVRMLEILEDEMISAMALAGLPGLSHLTPKSVCKAEAVTMPHEMSAWVNMPVGRIQ